MFERAALTSGKRKMWDGLLSSIVLLSKGVLQVFLGGDFFITRWFGSSSLESLTSNDVK